MNLYPMDIAVAFPNTFPLYSAMLLKVNANKQTLNQLTIKPFKDFKQTL